MGFLPAPGKCKWLPVSSLTNCGKPSFEDYCGIHAHALRKNPQSGPRPCLGCQRGVKGPYQICGHCGGTKYRALIAYYNKRVNKFYTKYDSPPTVEEFLANQRTNESTKL